MNRLHELLLATINSLALPVAILIVIAGAVCLIAGRRYYWLATGLNVFLATFLSTSILTHWPLWQNIAVAGGAGILMALLTIALSVISIAINGFYIFGLLIATFLLSQLPFESNSFTPVIIFFVVGSVAAFYCLTRPESGLLIISTFIGAFAFSAGLFRLFNYHASTMAVFGAWLVLGTAGCIWQVRQANQTKENTL